MCVDLPRLNSNSTGNENRSGYQVHRGSRHRSPRTRTWAPPNKPRGLKINDNARKSGKKRDYNAELQTEDCGEGSYVERGLQKLVNKTG